MKRVFVAGALSRKTGNEDRTPSKVVVDYLKNVHDLCLWSAALIKLGFSPFCPALDFVLGIVDGGLTEENYRQLSLDWLEVSDAVLVTSRSPGVDAEIRRAKELGIPVFDSLEELVSFRGEG